MSLQPHKGDRSRASPQVPQKTGRTGSHGMGALNQGRSTLRWMFSPSTV